MAVFFRLRLRISKRRAAAHVGLCLCVLMVAGLVVVGPANVGNALPVADAPVASPQADEVAPARIGASILPGGEDVVTAAMSHGDFGYFATARDTRGGTPAVLVKVRLSDMTRVGSLTLNADEGHLVSAVTDGEFGYFGLGRAAAFAEAGRLVKVRLSDMTRVGEVTLNAGENELEAAVIVGEFGYFAGGYQPLFAGGGWVVKVRLSDMTRVGSVALPYEFGPPNTIATDGEFGYVGANRMLFKVRLSDLSLAGLVGFDAGVGSLESAVIVGDFGYFGTLTDGDSANKVVKVRLSDLTQMDLLALDGEGSLEAAVTDGVFGYFVAYGLLPQRVLKVRLSDMTRVGEYTIDPDTSPSAWVVYHGGFLYVGTNDPGRITKLRSSDMSRVGSLFLNTAGRNTVSAVTDGEYMYLGDYGDGGFPIPGQITKVRLPDMTRVGSLNLNYGEQNLFAALIVGEFGYFGTSKPSFGGGEFSVKVIKVRLSDMTRVGAVTLPVATGLRSAITDGTFGYFGTGGFPGQVVKVRLSDLTWITTLTLNAQENQLRLALTDGTFGYFGMNGGRDGGSFQGLVKVRLSDMTRVGAVILEESIEGEDDLTSAITDGTFGYFGTTKKFRDVPAQVIKVRLSDMTRVGAVTLNAGEEQLSTAITDGTFGYFGTTRRSFTTYPGKVVKVRLSDMTRVGAVALNAGEDSLSTAVSTGSFGYFGTYSNPGRVVKVQLGSLAVPRPPRVAVVTPRTGELAVSWRAPIDDGGSAVTGYTATVVPGGRSCSTSATSPEQSPAMSCVVSGLASTGRYRVTVAASNAIGPSLPSAPSVEVTPGAGSAIPEFSDVPVGSFFGRATSMLKLRGITVGTNAAGDEYSPYRPVNRQQMAQFLWRMAGRPDAPASCGFSDEASIGGAARVAACWLKAEGITTNNPYRPAAVVDRQQMAAFLWRFADRPDAPSPCGFSDEGSIAGFAKVPACWLKFTGITINDPYLPTGVVTRAQMAAFLYRLGAELNLWVRTDG